MYLMEFKFKDMLNWNDLGEKVMLWIKKVIVRFLWDVRVNMRKLYVCF